MDKLPIAAFADRLTALMPKLIRGFVSRQSDALSKGKISLPQYLVIDFIYTNGPQRMSDLAKQSHVTFPAMTGLVGRLHNSGMIRRVYDPKDRRTIKIELTKKGCLLVDSIVRQRRGKIVNVFSRISPEERQAYLSILTKVSTIVS